jgi:hypothetical protein
MTPSTTAFRGAALALSVFLISGCTGLESTLAGALIGGGAGAVIGHQSDELVAGALIGVLVGGAIGYAVGEARADRVANASSTNRANGYRAVEGLQVRVSDAAVSPKLAEAGEDVDLSATVAVMSPRTNDDVTIRQRIGLYRGDQLVGKILEDTFVVKPGTHRLSRRITLQSGFARGDYTYVTHIKAFSHGDFAEATKEESFEVG